MQIILASSSPYRQTQLRTLGLPFVTARPGVDESWLAGETALCLASRLAREKARAVAAQFPAALVIGADQTVAFGEQILGKPGDYHAAVQQLQQLRGQTVTFHSALALLDTRDGHLQQAVVDTVVTYRPLTDAQIIAYLRRDQPYDCAGSFKSESLGIAILESVHSDDPSALVGLPLMALVRLLAAAGVDVLAADCTAP